MSGGGSINLRMSLKGADSVRAELASLGPAGQRMGRELDRAMRQPSPAIRALDSGLAGVRGGVEGLAARLGPAGAGLSALGVAGLATAAALAGIAIAAAAAVQGIQEATAAAAQLTDTAARIGVGTEALQQWRYVADEAGVATQQMEANLEKLNGTLGAFKLGIGDGKLKPIFEELGITKAQLADVQTSDQLLMLLADTLGQVSDRAAQVRMARGLGVEESLPIIRLGSERIRELLGASVELGFVIREDVTASLDESDRAMERAGQQMRIIRDTAVAPLAEMFADAATYVAGLSIELNNIESHAPNWIRTLLAIGRVLPGHGQMQRIGELVGAQVTPDVAARQDRDPNTVTDPDDPMLLRQRMAGMGRARFEPRGHTSGGGGGGAAAREAERRRREGKAALEELAREELTAERAALQARFGPGGTEPNRTELDLALNTIKIEQQVFEREALRKRLADAGVLDQVIEARLVEMKAAQEAAAQAEDDVILRDEALRLAETRREIEEQHLQITSDILSIASSQARTSAERREIELRLLKIAQRRERAELEAAIAAETDAKRRAGLTALLGRMPELHAAQRGDVERRNAGPVDRWRDSQIRSMGEFREFMDGEVLSALDGVSRGLIDAWRNAESAGDAFSRMGDVAVDALSRVVDALMEVALQRLLIEPMIAALFGSGQGGSSGGLLGSFLSNLGGSLFGGAGFGAPKSAPPVPVGKGYAAGGSVGARGLYPVGERGIELLDLPPGSVVHDADRSRRLVADMAGGMRTPVASAGPPIVNMAVTIVNRTSEPVSARTTQTPQGIDIILEPVVRAGVARMGRDGSLAAAAKSAPPPIRR